MGWGVRAVLNSNETHPIYFYNETVDLVVDGERQERPATPWS